MTELVDLAEDAIERAVPGARWARAAAIATVVVLAAIALGFAAWWLFVRPIEAKRAADQASVDAAMSNAAGAVAADAIPAIVDAGRRRDAVDGKVQKGISDVRAAPDAGVAVRGVSDALRRNVCLYDDLYTADRACQSLHEDPAGVGPPR